MKELDRAATKDLLLTTGLATLLLTTQIYNALSTPTTIYTATHGIYSILISLTE